MRTLLLIALSAGCSLAAGELSNRRAPGFSLPDSNFKQYDPQDYRGKLLLIEIMQTSCPHCARFSAILEEVRSKYGAKVAILSIVNPPDNQATVAKYIADHNIKVPILFDCGQAAASYVRATPQNPSLSIPHVFLIDPEGVIRKDFRYGPDTKEIFEGTGLFSEVDRLLTGTPAGSRKAKNSASQ